MTTTTEKKTVKITLSERRPVRIDPEEWPVIASAKRFWGGNGIACQANEEAWIKVRQHDDGRTLVYCDRDRGPGGMPIEYRGSSGGFLLPPAYVQGNGPDAGRSLPSETDEIIRAIRRCAGIIDSDELGDECIADLPAEEI
jgi:hypothetical protein